MPLKTCIECERQFMSPYLTSATSDPICPTCKKAELGYILCADCNCEFPPEFMVQVNGGWFCPDCCPDRYTK